MIYLLHKTDGTTERIEKSGTMTLKEMQKCVGGYIEMVWVGEPYNSACLMVNEDGLMLKLPQNPKYPQLVGNVLEGAMTPGKDGYDFVGIVEGGE